MELEDRCARRAAFASVGCKVNRYDAQKASAALEGAGYDIVAFSDKADVYVINTCAVTGEAAKKSRGLIRRAVSAKLALNPRAIVVVAGCWSQVEREEALAIPGVSVVLGTGDYDRIVEIIEDKLKEEPDDRVCAQRRELGTEEIIKAKKKDMTRAYLKIEDGCENFCSYCIIPFARGAVKSRPINDILREAEDTAQRGTKEIVITGIHVASYGKDLYTKTGLADVCRAVDSVNGLARLRLSSISPMAVTEEFVQTLKSLNTICDYFHLSLQSGAEKVLSRMGRGYSPDDYLNAVKILKDAFGDCAIWSDVIAGFPGETDADFEESLEFIERSGINNLHVFPFSPKKGTKAYEMDGRVKNHIKDERAGILKKLGDKLYESFLNERLGKEYDVLFELKKGGFYFGHTSNYILTKVVSDADITNEIVRVKLDKTEKRNGVFEVLGVRR